MTPRSAFTARGPRVVAMGDSITLGIGDATVPGIGAGWAAHVAQVNGALGMAVAGTGVHFVNGAEVFAKLGASAWHIDRIHPSPAGHRALAEEALRVLAARYPQVRPIDAPGARPSLLARAWWLTRQGLPWIAKRSRDLIPQMAKVVTHELLGERRAKGRTRATTTAWARALESGGRPYRTARHR